MKRFSYDRLEANAEREISAASVPPRKLVLYHSLITAGAVLLAALVQLLLQNQIDNTGGLSGMDSRAVLSTVETLLSGAVRLGLPFWQFGLTFAIWSVHLQRQTEYRDLTLGFRNFGPVLRFLLLNGLLILGVMMLLVYPLCGILMVTPLGSPLTGAVEAQIAAGVTDMNTMLEDPTLYASMASLVGIAILLSLIVLIPLSYRLRMGRLALAEDPKAGAMNALRKSVNITRKNSMALFRLDLHFWWYFLAMGLTGLLTYGDSICAALNIALPISATAQFFLFYALGLAAQTALLWAFGAKVELTYASAYDALTEERRQAPEPQSPYARNSKNFPS